MAIVIGETVEAGVFKVPGIGVQVAAGLRGCLAG